MPDRGVLVIADISGYSRFVGGVELEHAADIVADLLGVAVEQLAAVATLAKLEGDAAFCVSPNVPSVDTIMGALFACYDAFRRRLRDAKHLTTCSCAACSQMVSLDLKVIMHVGDYVTHRVAGHEEVAGGDVILVHRLLKNSVTNTGYALFTERAVAAIDLPVDRWGCSSWTEAVDDVGDVRVHVIDLAALWVAEQERTSVIVPEDGARVVTYDVQASVPIVWDWMSDPQKRRQWNGADSIVTEVADSPSGVGTVNHCVHGKMTINEEIVDWKPFDHCTFRNRAPFGTFLFMVDVKPIDDGTRVQFRFRPERGGFAATKFALAFKFGMKPSLDKGIARLRELVSDAARPQQ